MKIIFDVKHLYYLPQYLPVIAELANRGIGSQCVFYRDPDAQLQQVCERAIKEAKLRVIWCYDWRQALDFYMSAAADWLVFGNAVADLERIHTVSKTVLMQHGIGPKSCYYDVSENQTSVRFVEGQHRLKRLLELYPNGQFIDTGYAKLDPLLNDSLSGARLDLVDLGLDPTKRTILYAPTFYPSSIECMHSGFPEHFSDFNIIVKPHFFSLTKPKYSKQLKIMQDWAGYDNVYLAKVDDYNLVPFMAVSDLMMSDASSAIFEFAALHKPVVWCDFYQLRWSYRGVFKFRFKNRLDEDIDYFNNVASRAKSYRELISVVGSAFAERDRHQQQQTVYKLAGNVDGQCSVRIVDYLIGEAG